MVENICAIATPYGQGAISIIRCSGPHAIDLVNKVFKGKDLNKCASHTIHYGHIMNKGEEVDEVLCNVFKGPNSFDGEDTVEINCHGGVYVTNCVLQTLLANGFRMAERGEFSKRAFLNKRLDLTQAEAIMDIISSQNSLALKTSNASLRSSTFKLIKNFRDKLLDILAKIEVNIDYPEYDDAITITNEYLKPVINAEIKEMQQILENSKLSTIAIHGINTAIIGKPNVGKSSLLNMLLDEDKAIVSSVAGTTRDLVEGTLNVKNVTLHLIDTAGIHESSDLVENIGIKRSTEALKKADLVLLVLDSSAPLDAEDERLLQITKDKKRIIIANKEDIKENYWSLPDVIYISAINKMGLDDLANRIYQVTNLVNFKVDDHNYLNNSRQVSLMYKAYEALLSAQNGIDEAMDIDLIEIDVKNAFDYLGQITGEAYPEELITALFTKFCLGK